MTEPRDMDRPPKRLIDRLPHLELDAHAYRASVSAEAARIDRKELDRQVHVWNAEITDAMGEPVDIQADELFIKFNDGVWSYRTPDPSSQARMVNARGLFEGLQVMDTLEVGLALPNNNEEYDRLVLCVAVVPETSHADWERELVPIKSIISMIQIPDPEFL